MKTRFLVTVFALSVLLAACAPAATATTAPTLPPVANANEVKVDISGFAFNPGSITIKVGQTVTWTNNDSASHNVIADDGSFSSKTLATGDSFSFTFDKAGSYTYKCGFHARMTATVVVQP